MVDLPHRFVPTSSRFVSPVRIVAQTGHTGAICAAAFSPCLNFFATADTDGFVKIWVLETLDILGSYALDFQCENIVWDGLDAVICKGCGRDRRIEFPGVESNYKAPEPIDPSRIIRLIGSPEISTNGNILRITYNEQTFEHDVDGLMRCIMDPCERYAVAVSPKNIIVFSCYEDEEILRIPAEENSNESGAVWIDASISERGDNVACVSKNGSVCILHPMDKKLENRIKFARRGNETISVCCFGGSHYILLGNAIGNITLFDRIRDAVLLRIPRAPRSFDAIFPSPDRIGFLALRSESATAFFGYSQEILTASPLPAPLSASCIGTAFSEIFTACGTDVYRLTLDNNDISKVCTLKVAPDIMASNGTAMLFHFSDKTWLFHNGTRMTEVKIADADKPDTLAISANAKMAAASVKNALCMTSLADGTVQNYSFSADIRALIFGKDKTASTVFAFRQDGVISAVDFKTGEIRDLNTLSVPYARIISVAPAAKSFCFLLAEIEHGQFVVLRVGLNTGKNDIALRIIPNGTDIWAASMNEQTANFRSEAECLRIISGLKAYSVDDWVRSEPLAIF